MIVSSVANLDERWVQAQLDVLESNRVHQSVPAALSLLEAYTQAASFDEVRAILFQVQAYRAAGQKHPLLRVADRAAQLAEYANGRPANLLREGDVVYSVTGLPPARRVIKADMAIAAALAYRLCGEPILSATTLIRQAKWSAGQDISTIEWNPRVSPDQDAWYSFFTQFSTIYFKERSDHRSAVLANAGLVAAAMAVAGVKAPRWLVAATPEDTVLRTFFSELWAIAENRCSPEQIRMRLEQSCERIYPKPSGWMGFYREYVCGFPGGYDLEQPQAGALHLLMLAARCCLEQHIHAEQLKAEGLFPENPIKPTRDIRVLPPEPLTTFGVDLYGDLEFANWDNGDEDEDPVPRRRNEFEEFEPY